MEFVKWFQRLITPPNGRERVAIHQQIEQLVDEATKSDLEAMFDPPRVAEHVYYIVGFLCDAGSKEALRRSKKSNVGECIKAINSHFAIGRDEEKVREIKQSLPQGVTNLVDQRCHFGGLKYKINNSLQQPQRNNHLNQLLVRLHQPQSNNHLNQLLVVQHNQLLIKHKSQHNRQVNKPMHSNNQQMTLDTPHLEMRKRFMMKMRCQRKINIRCCRGWQQKTWKTMKIMQRNAQSTKRQMSIWEKQTN